MTRVSRPVALDYSDLVLPLLIGPGDGSQTRTFGSAGITMALV